MPQRYTVIQHYKIPYWLSGCPIVLTAHALTKDTVNGSIFVQCKFENLGSRTIKAAYFQIQCYDADRKPLDSIDFSYQNLYITKSEIFGKKTLIPLPSNKTRFYTVTPLRIVYSGISVDGNEWTNEGNMAFEAAVDGSRTTISA